MTRIAHYVRSTHWDREWYEPFQGYRMRLVSMLDEVLENLRKDSAFKFVMDGQTIPVYDYLEVRLEKGRGDSSIRSRGPVQSRPVVCRAG